MITRTGYKGCESVRPSIQWNMTPIECVGQVIEDARNIMERIEHSQMLQCDVAGAIKSMALEIHCIRVGIDKLVERKRKDRARHKKAGRPRK